MGGNNQSKLAQECTQYSGRATSAAEDIYPFMEEATIQKITDAMGVEPIATTRGEMLADFQQFTSVKLDPRKLVCDDAVLRAADRLLAQLSRLDDAFTGCLPFHVAKLDDLEKSQRPLTELVTALEKETFSYTDRDTVDCERAVKCTVRRLIQCMGRMDRAFAGCTIHNVGSHWDGTRVSHKPDEFDFFVVLDVCNLETRQETNRIFTVRIPEVAALKNDQAESIWNKFTQSKRPTHTTVDLSIDENIVEPSLFDQTCQAYVIHAAQRITLPRGLTHAGFRTPTFTWVVKNQPANTLHLLWKGQTAITIDIVFGIPLPMDRLDVDTKRSLGRLVEISGLEPSGVSLLHLLVRQGRWLATTVVLEVAMVKKLGRESQFAKHLLGLKLLCTHHLTLTPSLAEVHSLKDSIDDVVKIFVGSSANPQHNRLGLKERLQSTHFCAVQDHANRNALYLAILHMVDAQGVPHMSLSQHQHDYIASLHPAVAAAIGEPVKPFAAINSAYLKYFILNDMMSGPTEAGRSKEKEPEQLPYSDQTEEEGSDVTDVCPCEKTQPSTDQAATGEDELTVESVLLRCLKQLAVDMTDRTGIRHPALGLGGYYGVAPFAGAKSDSAAYIEMVNRFVNLCQQLIV